MSRLVDTLKKLPEVTDEIAENLIEAGLYTIKLIDEAPEGELKAVEGVTPEKAKVIKEYLKKAAERKPKKKR